MNIKDLSQDDATAMGIAAFGAISVFIATRWGMEALANASQNDSGAQQVGGVLGSYLMNNHPIALAAQGRWAEAAIGLTGPGQIYNAGRWFFG